jgi:hypothetical protein
MVAIGSLAAYSVHCYGDIGLESFQGCLVFGAALGTAGKVAAWSESLRTTSANEAWGGRGLAAPKPGPKSRKARPRFGPATNLASRRRAPR